MQNFTQYDNFFPAALPQFDLVEEASWEDNVEFLTLEEAGLEEEWDHAFDTESVVDFVAWMTDGEDSRYL